jgi:PDZ domain
MHSFSSIAVGVLLSVLPTCLHAQDYQAPIHKVAVISPQSPDLPWLGFQIERVTDTVRAQLPQLLKGTGFVITSVDPQSPCNQAGLLSHDIIWKFGDQILVNEAQLDVLLHHRAPGDSVKISLYRAGKELQTEIIIGKRPAPTVAILGPSMDSARNIGGNIPDVTPVSPPADGQRTATLEVGDALIQIETRDDGLWLSIDDKGVNVFDDVLNEQNEKNIPPAWLEPVRELRQTLQKRNKVKP